MRLDDAPESSNVSDNRGMGGVLAIGGGVGGILLAILGLVFGVDLGGGKPAAGPSGPPDEKTLTFTKKVLAAPPKKCGVSSSKRWGRSTGRAAPGTVLRPRENRVRHGPLRGRAVLLPARRNGVHRPDVLQRTAAETRRIEGRLLEGVRDRPRGRSPRPEAPRLLGPRTRQRCVRALGTPGRLPRGRVGTLRGPEVPGHRTGGT